MELLSEKLGEKEVEAYEDASQKTPIRSLTLHQILAMQYQELRKALLILFQNPIFSSFITGVICAGGGIASDISR